MILYKSMTDRISKDKKILTNFEKAITNAALSKDIDLVICGHTHVPVDKIILSEKGTVRYINCGDWVENLTAAEYSEGEWSINYYLPVQRLEDILRRMQPHQAKKRSMLRELHLAHSLTAEAEAAE